jgi:hypothetical protein
MPPGRRSQVCPGKLQQGSFLLLDFWRHKAAQFLNLAEFLATSGCEKIRLATGFGYK